VFYDLYFIGCICWLIYSSDVGLVPSKGSCIYTDDDGMLIGEIRIGCERKRSWPNAAAIPVFYKATEKIYGKLRS